MRVLSNFIRLRLPLPIMLVRTGQVMIQNSAPLHHFLSNNRNETKRQQS
jgi:hypothetical protein